MCQSAISIGTSHASLPQPHKYQSRKCLMLKTYACRKLCYVSKQYNASVIRVGKYWRANHATENKHYNMSTPFPNTENWQVVQTHFQGRHIDIMPFDCITMQGTRTSHYDDITWTSCSLKFGRFFISLCGLTSQKHQSPRYLCFARGLHEWMVHYPRRVPVTQKKLQFDDVIMSSPDIGIVWLEYTGSTHIGGGFEYISAPALKP